MNDSRPTKTSADDDSPSRIVLLVRFTMKPGTKDAFIDKLAAVVERMRKEDTFLDAVIHQNVDRPEELVIYETWLGTRNSWLRDEMPRSYRAEYEQELSKLLENRSVEWLTPMSHWSRE